MLRSGLDALEKSTSCRVCTWLQPKLGGPGLGQGLAAEILLVVYGVICIGIPWFNLHLGSSSWFDLQGMIRPRAKVHGSQKKSLVLHSATSKFAKSSRAR